jgi:hypothetical protein
MEFQLINQDGVYPNSIEIGSLNLFSPNQKARIDLRIEIENYLRAKYKPGVYSGNSANEISQYLFSFYNSEFKKNIKRIDNTYFIYFTLFQSDVASRIHHQFRSNKLNENHTGYWEKNGPLIRRTLSYLLDEMILQFEFPEITTQPFLNSLVDFERFFLLSEKAIEYSIISNELFYLNNSYKVKINPEGSDYFMENIKTKQSKHYSQLHEYYVNQTTTDSSLREKYIIGKAYEQDWIKHGAFLNDSFKETIGLSYHEFMYLLTSISINTNPINSEKDIPLVRKDEFLNDLSKQFKITIEQINHFFDGLILRKQHFDLNGRTFTKFKQMYRVGKRPFLEICKSDGTYLTWSNELLKERLNFLDNDFIFKTLPPEWNNKIISLSVNKISNDAGKWFESQVKQNLLKIGFHGDQIKDKITLNKGGLNCHIVGGFDFLGYSPRDNIIVMVECKFINPGFEPKSYNDDLESFTNSKNGYLKKMDNKVNWIENNFDDIKKELSIRLKISIPDSCSIIGTAFFTYIKTFAFAFIEKYPCVSFTEFLDKYEKLQKWYFKSGLKTCNKYNSGYS